MSKSFKFKNNIYLDSKGITHNKELLSNLLTNLTPLIKREEFTVDGFLESGTAYKEIFSYENNKDSDLRMSIMHVYIKWNSNATGDRGLNITNNDASLDLASTIGRAAEFNTTRQTLIYPYRFGRGEIARVRALQNSGGNLYYVATIRIYFFDSL